jgi:hypothetical protein
MSELAQRMSRTKTIAISILKMTVFCLLLVGLVALFVLLMLLSFKYVIEEQISFYLGSVLVFPHYILSYLPIPLLGIFLVFLVEGLMRAFYADSASTLSESSVERPRYQPKSIRKRGPLLSFIGAVLLIFGGAFLRSTGEAERRGDLYSQVPSSAYIVSWGLVIFGIVVFVLGIYVIYHDRTRVARAKVSR